MKLWTPPSDTTTTLRHGATGKRGSLTRGAVQSLDLGSRLVTFLWSIEGPGVAGYGGWEVRADRLSDGRSFLAGTGFQGEACTGGTELVAPSAPVADGDDVWYSQLSAACYKDTVSVVHFRTRQRRGIAGGVSDEILQFAKDGRSLYALVAPKPTTEDRPTCSAPGAPCLLERIESPARFAKIPRQQSPLR